MATLEDLIGGGIPTAPEGTLPIGAVDARPGSKLYEIAKRQAQRPRQQASTRRRPADVLASLMSKFTPGAAAPGEGMVPFGELPPQMQQLAGKAWGQPLVGVDPRQLDTEERFLLEKMRRMGKQELRQRVDAQPPRPMPQGPYAGVVGRGGVM